MTCSMLVVDDAMIIREMIKDIALTANFSVAGEATDGQAAIDQYRACQPDLVTLDLVMPQYDGLHALRGIKELNPRAQVLIVSALDQSEILKQALMLGASDFIVKPFNDNQLRSALCKQAQRIYAHKSS